MKTQIPWLRVFVEGGVIVGSILLAFGIQAWWEQSRDAAIERQQIEALAEDFSKNVELLTQRQLRVELSVRRLTRVRDLLRATPSGSQVAIPDSILNEVRTMGTIDPVRGTLDAMVGSGSLDQLSDTALRAALTDWQRLVSDVRTDQVLGQQYTVRELIPFLATQGDWSHTLVMGADIREGETILTASPGLITMIAGKLLTDQWISFDIAPLVERTRESIS